MKPETKLIASAITAILLASNANAESFVYALPYGKLVVKYSPDHECLSGSSNPNAAVLEIHPPGMILGFEKNPTHSLQPLCEDISFFRPDYNPLCNCTPQRVLFTHDSKVIELFRNGRNRVPKRRGHFISDTWYGTAVMICQKKDMYKRRARTSPTNSSLQGAHGVIQGAISRGTQSRRDAQRFFHSKVCRADPNPLRDDFDIMVREKKKFESEMRKKEVRAERKYRNQLRLEQKKKQRRKR